MKEKLPKDFIVGDIHGTADAIQKTLKDVGFEIPTTKNISLGSPAEEVPQVSNMNASDIVKSVRESIELREKANVNHHDAQYEKMHPKKIK